MAPRRRPCRGGRVGAANRIMKRWLKSSVVTAKEKAQIMRQLGTGKASESKPLMTYRDQCAPSTLGHPSSPGTTLSNPGSDGRPDHRSITLVSTVPEALLPINWSGPRRFTETLDRPQHGLYGTDCG